MVEATYKAVKQLKRTANLRFSIDLDSLDFEMEVLLTQLEKSKGYLFFSNDPVREEAIKIIKNKSIGIDESGLSNSEKLRLESWRIWNKLEEDISFEDFYNNVTNRMLKAIKKAYGTD